MFEEKQEVYAAEFLYRELGCYQNGRKQYRQSYPAFNKAVELTPTDLRALLGRSLSRAKGTYYTCALDDVRRTLKAHPGDLRAIQAKAVYTFLRTDFEAAMVMNQRGSYQRKQPDSFVIGAMQCAEETERTIGKRGGRALRDHYDIIRTIAWKKAIDLKIGKIWKPRNKKRIRKPKHADNTPVLYTNYLRKIKQERLGTTNSQFSILESMTEKKSSNLGMTEKERSQYQPPQARTSNIDSLMAEKYLGKMCYDKWCLRDLKNDPRINSPNHAGTIAIKTLARKGHRNVKYRQEILRTREPYYAIKYNEVVPKGNFLVRQLQQLAQIQNVAKHDTETLIKLLRAAREAYFTNTAVEIAYKAKTYIDKRPLKILPNKEQYLRQLYELIGLVHLDNYRLKEKEGWNPKYRINALFGLPISRDPSEDSVVKNNKKEFMSLRSAIANAVEITEKRLAKATTPLETVWLYYDLARFSLDLKKYDLSRFYSRKALNMAKVLDNNVWATNVNMLITSAHVRQQNKNEAKNELVRTLEFAENLACSDIINYINKCIEEVDLIDFDEISIRKVIEEREKEIENALVDKDTKKEIQILFMRIDNIPGNRRMSIMPGLRFEDDVSPGKSTSKASIKPKSEAELEFQRQLPQKKGLELLETD